MGLPALDHSDPLPQSILLGIPLVTSRAADVATDVRAAVSLDAEERTGDPASERGYVLRTGRRTPDLRLAHRLLLAEATGSSDAPTIQSA